MTDTTPTNPTPREGGTKAGVSTCPECGYACCSKAIRPTDKCTHAPPPDTSLLRRCEHCGSDRIYSGPPDCPTCGAPVCCQTCCKIAGLERQIDDLRCQGPAQVERECASVLIEKDREAANAYADKRLSECVLLTDEKHRVWFASEVYAAFHAGLKEAREENHV